MNGYVCSKAWYDFAYANPKRIKPIHHAIVNWIFEKANESEWSEEFQLPTVEACTILGITDRDTYQKGLKELIDFGAVKITQESQGRYVARWVTLETCSIYLPKKQVSAQVSKGVGKQVSKGVGTTTGTTVGTTPNIKLKKPKETLETIETLETDDDADRVGFENEFSDPVSKEKKSTSPKVAPKGSPTLHARIKVMIESLNPGYYWQAKDGKATQSLIKKIRHRWQNKHGSVATDDNVVESLQWVMDNLPEWYRDKWDTCTIESKFEAILKQITEDRANGKSDKTGSTNPTGISPRLQSAWELLAQSRKASKSADGAN
jgi:DNA-binding transcriptional regulator YhcF (GntR family)